MDDLVFLVLLWRAELCGICLSYGKYPFPVLYYLAAWLEMAVVRNHVALFVPINILLNAALSWYLYSIGWRLSRAKAIGFYRGHVLGQPYGILPDRTGF